MALTKPSKPKGKAGASKRTSKPSTNGGISKRKAKQAALAKPGGPQKTKPSSATQPKKKKKVYTEKELGIPKLNMITPAGVQKPKGKKKGKIFVDDQESMITILAMVNADKEGQIESKMMKAVS
jgi:60S ribosomal subunit assembly/export protein LOC1